MTRIKVTTHAEALRENQLQTIEIWFLFALSLSDSCSLCFLSIFHFLFRQFLQADFSLGEYRGDSENWLKLIK